MSTRHLARRLAAPVGSLGLLVGSLGLAGCGGDDTATPTTTTTVTGSEATGTTQPDDTTTTTEAGHRIEVEVRGGEVVGGPRRESVPLGAEVVLVVDSDTTDEVHVHTYDLFADVGPGAPAELGFTADIPGVHEVELEERHILLLRLEVS